ncbi:MAG TPA: M48 family metallopeptidase [Fimbriimonadaceae bacterium]|nr:M48 family metallopeptidase [Fimbriimonadaceae bacterium]
MKRQLGLTLTVGLAMAMVAPAAIADPFKPGKADQVKLGQRAAAEIRQKEKVLPASDERVKVLRRVASRLLSVVDDGKDPWQYSFDVVQNKEVNAFALPGGPTFFFTGLLDRLSTEDQLAGVLAHELTHVRREHWAYAYRDQQQRALGLNLLLIFTRANNNVAGLASIANDLIFNLPFSRKHESEADDQGMDMMVKAGYNPNGIKDVFQILAKASGSGGAPEFLSTHPNDKNRIKHMEDRIAKLNRTFPAQRPLPWAR